MAFGRRFKRAMRRTRKALKRGAKATGKGLRKGATAVHNATHKGPIARARNAVASVVKKIPVAKQFVEVGEFSSGLIHKGLKKTGVLGKSAAEPMKKAKNTRALLNAAAKLPVKEQQLALVAMASTPTAGKAMRAAGQLTKSKAATAAAAKKAVAKLRSAAKKGNKAARKALAIAAATHQVARGKHTAAKKTMAAASKKKKRTTYLVRNLTTGKETRVTL